MPVWTEDSDKANSRSHRNIRLCGGNKCGTKREHCKLYSKERHTGGLAGRLDGKPLLCSYYLAYGVSGQHTTFTLCQNAACSDEHFSPLGRWVDYDWAKLMCIIFTACFTVRGRDMHWFSAVYFRLKLFAFWCESRTFSLSPFKR